MNNKKGYTLVEILAVATILGIIVSLSIPGIRMVNNKTNTKKYNIYKTTLLNAAKIYLDKNEEDLFGNKSSGCNIITYDNLIKAELIKDIDIKNISCNSENTFVQVNKWNNQYYYKVSLGCGENKNKKLLEEELTYKTETIDKTLCLGTDDSNNIIISSTNIKEDDTNTKTTKIKLTSFSGISPNSTIYYSFAKTMNYEEINDFNVLPINIPSKEKQIKELENANPVEIISNTIKTEENGNGDYYLVVKIDNLEDLEGIKWINSKDNTNYKVLGNYYIDTTKPEFNDSKVVSDNTEYNGLKPSLQLNVQDNYSNQESLRMCVSIEKDTCPKTIADFNKEKYIKYQSNYSLTINEKKLNGTKHLIYVTVVDEANNYNTKEFEYQLGYSYTITYKNPGGLSCKPKSKTVTNNVGEEKVWGDLCVPTKEGMIFEGWNTSKKGDKETITKDTIANKSITVYAVYKAHICRIIYDNNEGEFLTNNNNLEDSCDYKNENSTCNDRLKSTDTFFNARKSGYHLEENEEWISGNGEVFSDKKEYKVTEVCKNIAIGDETILLKANWQKD